MATDLSPEELARIIKKLEASGYEIKRRGTYIKKTFDIDQDLWTQADDLRRKLKITVRDVFAEALALWLEQRNVKR
jgi:DNA-binding Lrp family transcriptional regulator